MDRICTKSLDFSVREFGKETGRRIFGDDGNCKGKILNRGGRGNEALKNTSFPLAGPEADENGFPGRTEVRRVRGELVIIELSRRVALSSRG